MWSFAALEISDGPLCKAISGTSISRIGSGAFEPQGLANTAWSFATLSFRDAPFMDAIATAALRKMHEFKAQALANMSWAFATLWVPHAPLLDAIAAEAMRKGDGGARSTFAAQELANIAWAYAVLHFAHEPLIDAIAAAARLKLREQSEAGGFSSQQLANIAWAFATLECQNEPLMDAIAGAAIRMIRAGSMDAQGLATMSWALSRRRLPPGGAGGIAGSAAPQAPSIQGSSRSPAWALLLASEDDESLLGRALDATAGGASTSTAPLSPLGPLLAEGEQTGERALELTILQRMDGLGGFHSLGSFSGVIRVGCISQLEFHQK